MGGKHIPFSAVLSKRHLLTPNSIAPSLFDFFLRGQHLYLPQPLPHPHFLKNRHLQRLSFLCQQSSPSFAVCINIGVPQSTYTGVGQSYSIGVEQSTKSEWGTAV